jgi:8-hydroxy-5-deazaflavin:NADPH oxidoreductase
MAKKTIAIIGATEDLGAAIAKNLSIGNYRLLLFGHDVEKLNAVAEEIKNTNPAADIDCLGCMVDAGWEADIIISAVPFATEKEIVEKIRDVATQKIVISIANPLNTTVSSGTSAAEELQKLLPNSKIVKAFNTLLAADFAPAIADGKQIDSFIAGDDREAVQTVREIVTTAGFHAIIAGELATSRALENRHYTSKSI